MAAPSALCGSPVYMAPEVVAADGAHLRTRRFAPYDGRAADAWSAGVTLFEAAFGGPPLRPPAKALDPLAEMAALHAAWVRPLPLPRQKSAIRPSAQGAAKAPGKQSPWQTRHLHEAFVGWCSCRGVVGACCGHAPNRFHATKSAAWPCAG